MSKDDDLPDPDSMFEDHDYRYQGKLNWQYGYPEIIFVVIIGISAFLAGVFSK